jgi:hypothetical protein
VIVCGIDWKPRLEGEDSAASAILLVNVPPSAPAAAAVTKPRSTERRCSRAAWISRSGRLLDRLLPMSSASVTTTGS